MAQPYDALLGLVGSVGNTLASRRACKSAFSSLPPTNSCTQTTRSLAVEMPAPAAQPHDGFASVWSPGASVPARAAACTSAGSAGGDPIVSTLLPYMYPCE